MVPFVYGAIGYLTSNALGLNDMLQQTFNPSIASGLGAPASAPQAFEYANGEYIFHLDVIAPSNGDLKAIDDFFEAYGYKVNKFEVPKLDVRDNFTFVKTRDAVVYSSVNKAAEQFAAMLNGGTKFWKGEIGK